MTINEGSTFTHPPGQYHDATFDGAKIKLHNNHTPHVEYGIFYSRPV